MSVLSRPALEDSPLADLHTIATELGLDGFRRLRKADLIDRILERAGGDAAEPSDATDGDADTDASTDAGDETERPRARRGRRGGRGRTTVDSDSDADSDDAAAISEADARADAKAEGNDEEAAPAPRRSRSRRGGGGGGREERSSRDDDSSSERKGRNGRNGRSESSDRDSSEDRVAEGVVELLGNGSGFLRVSPPEASDDDVYVSAAQVRRCELVSGDKISGPVRPPRRSERYPSLVRIDTINDRAADEVAEGTHFDDLPAGYATERFSFGGDDPTLKAIEWLTPIGRGSRATIVGGARAGKSETLRRLALALREQDGVELTIALAGVRPEELTAWAELGVDANAALTLVASAEAQGQLIERTIDTARRVAARGGNAVVLIDSLDYVPAAVARRALAAARNIVDGGSLTVIATSSAAVGGETTVVALDAALTATGRIPALDIVASGTLRPELLVGQAGADAITQARAAKIG
ncbi:MAG TPA: Rho termination factor N-terminal domain-containing protein [Solirubrobacteraceae bacterium]|nr:Rho termination factor N-terminal domain-containing protein [Solirubrobacteraceae bacterium]